MQLEAWTRLGDREHALRARIVLACGEGLDNLTVARQLGVSPQTVGKWRFRFLVHGVDGLLDKPRPGRPRTVSEEDFELVEARTLDSIPPAAAPWSTRSMARASGLSQSTVARIWRTLGLQPRRWETFQISTDPQFADQVREVVGLYLNPPERAVVVRLDGPPRMEALDWAQAPSPSCEGSVARRGRDRRRSATTLVAALEAATEEVADRRAKPHPRGEFRRFLDLLGQRVPAGVEIHLLLDNFETHRLAQIHQWLLARGHSHLHFTSTSAAWLELLDRWVAWLTVQRKRGADSCGTHPLEHAIREYLETRDSSPRPFMWVTSPEEVATSSGIRSLG